MNKRIRNKKAKQRAQAEVVKEFRQGLGRVSDAAGRAAFAVHIAGLSVACLAIDFKAALKKT